MNLTLHVWRQQKGEAAGRMVDYKAANVNPDMSFLEMLDVVNDELIAKGEDPIAFDYDCREGICGSCCLMIDGEPHGPEAGVTTCQTYMRNFKDGDEIFIEPFRARAFPVLKDLVVDRGAFDRIIQVGGFVSVNTGGARTEMPSRSPRSRLRRRWTPRSASAVGRAWRRARMPRRCCSCPPRFRIWG